VRLLVLGAHGQLGHDMARVARAAGATVEALARTDLDLAASDLPTATPRANAESVAAGDAGAGEAGAGEADRGDADRGDAAAEDAAGSSITARLRNHRFDALINCAGFTRVDDAEADPAAAFAVNAFAAERLARECAERGAGMVHVSTDYVFDGSARRAYRESDPPAPLNIYGASKLMGEALVRAANPAGTLIVRTASLFGIAGLRRARAGQGGNFVETIIRRASETGRLQVVDDIVMSPTATADLARAILTLLQTGAPAGTYHVANRGQASWYEFACTILDVAGIHAEIEPVPSTAYPTAARRPPFSVLDTGKAIAAGCPLPRWEQALEEYVSARTSR
jgi:dTDP-4-dehydrorhamnose reductase